MGWFKKLIPKEIRRPIKAIVDPVIDLGASVVKAVISPFTGAFNLPDISIDTNIGTSEIRAATTVDFNGANRAVPVLYGNLLESGVIPVFIGTHGDNSADTSPQYLYMAGIISQGFHGSHQTLGKPVGFGSTLTRMTIDGKPVHLGGLSLTANDNYSQGFDGSTALNQTDNGGGILASGKGGVQPQIHDITKGTFANRLKIQYFDGSTDQPTSSLLREHPDWNDDQNTLSGMHYVALRFKIQAADEVVSGSDGNGTFGNPYGSVPSVVVTTSGRSTPALIAGKTSDPGYEERFITNYSTKDSTRFISYHRPLSGPDDDQGNLGGGSVVPQATHIQTVASDSDFEIERFQNFQPVKFSDGTTQPHNVHDILFNLGWTYEYVFFYPGTLNTVSNTTFYGSCATVTGDFSFGRLWLKHVGGGHYQFINKQPTGFRITMLSGAMTFFGYNSDAEARLNNSHPGEDLSGTSAEYRFYAPDNITSSIETNFNNGHATTLRIRDRSTGQNDLYDVTEVDRVAAFNFITLAIVNEDSSKPNDNFYTTVPINAEIYVEQFTGSANTNKNASSASISLANGYNKEGLSYQSYGCDSNPIEHILDYLLNPDYGVGLSTSEIDTESFVSAAIACDHFPNYFNFDETFFDLGGDFLDVFDRHRYMYGDAATTGASADGARFFIANNTYDRQFRIDTSRTFVENLNIMLSSIGAYMFYTDGKFKIKLENAGDPENSENIMHIKSLPITAVITDDEIIGSVSINTSALNDRFNQIKVDYTDLQNNSQANSVLSPDPIEDSTDIRTNYLNEDGGKVLESAFSLPGIFDPVTAKKVATLLLKKSRGQPLVALQISPIGINLAPGDFIRLNSACAGINEVFRVTDITLNPDGTVALNAMKHVPEFYDVSDTGQIFESQRPLLN
tara:strand:- start:145 stop:2859 length:2715 start_codon:yes stop_codon:yes gene_type:complete